MEKPKFEMNYDKTSREEYRVRTPNGEKLVTVVVVESKGDEKAPFGEYKKESVLLSCPCGRVIHTVAEGKAFCTMVDCGRSLCDKCAENNICAACGPFSHIVCIDHLRETWSGKKTCERRSFIARLFL